MSQRHDWHESLGMLMRAPTAMSFVLLALLLASRVIGAAELMNDPKSVVVAFIEDYKSGPEVRVGQEQGDGDHFRFRHCATQ